MALLTGMLGFGTHYKHFPDWAIFLASPSPAAENVFVRKYLEAEVKTLSAFGKIGASLILECRTGWHRHGTAFGDFQWSEAEMLSN